MPFRSTLLNKACDILSGARKELSHISAVVELMPEEEQVDVNNGWNTQTISKVQQKQNM